MDMQKLSFLSEKASRLPLNPGVYIIKDKASHIIYIGKAKALKKRVSQYFVRIDRHENKVRQMVEHADNFEYIITDSEFEALVLECSLIKQHKPKYNILLKDDKGYNYIKITLNELWPRITAEKKQIDDGAFYIGPYISSFAVKEAVDQAVKAFMLPTCTRRFPQEIGKGRPCLNYYIKQCIAPCNGKITKNEYSEAMNNAVTFLKGGYSTVFQKLANEMDIAAENLEFEKAAKLRDRITAIKKISERQKVVASKVEEQDVLAIQGDGCNTVIEIFLIRKGMLVDKLDFVFDYMQDEKAARAEFLMRYYSMAKAAPKQIILDGETEDKILIEQYFQKLFGHKVKIIVPQKGDQMRLINMAKVNAAEHLTQIGARIDKVDKVLEELKILLGMQNAPVYIEAYDISHTAGSSIVAGMVVFDNASPKKSAYKRFMVKTISTQDDYAAMREVVERRLLRYKKSLQEEQASKEGFARLPDLILLDGGKGHVSAVKPILEQLGLDIPLFGMVKDDKHHTRAITADGGEITINSNRNVFTLISKIQDEVHRFAITYHHSKQKKLNISSKLTEIPLIGQTRAKKLFIHFKTMQAIRIATFEELCQAPGMTKNAALSLKNWLDNN
jgi:excinuclease ABC subunit C